MCDKYINNKNDENKKGDEDMVLANKQKRQMKDTERKEMIKKASRAVNKQYSEAFKMISKN